MPLHRSSYKLKPTEPGAKDKFRMVGPDGTLTKTFVMRVPKDWTLRLERISEQLPGGWSMAEIVRLAVQKLEEQLKGDR